MNSPELEITDDEIAGLVQSLDETDWTGLTAALDGGRETIGGKLGVDAMQAGTVTTRTRRRRFTQTDDGTTLAKLLPKLPKTGETLHWLLDGSFVLGSVIPHVQKLIGKPVDLTLATLGLNDDTADTLANMMRDGRCSKLRLAMSSYFASADKDAANRIAGQLRTAGATVAVERNHAKLQLYRPTTGRARYVIETSSNLRSCNCVEFATITNDAALYNWHDQWLSKFFERNQPE